MAEQEDPSDPNAPLPPDAPPYVRAFYDTVHKLLNEIHDADPLAGEQLAEIWTWMQTHVPERLLRPRGEG